MNKRRMLALGLKCMFCGEQADSNEHVFGEWLQKWVETDLTGNHGQVITRFDASGGAVELADPEPFTHGGGAMTRRLPVTCAGCNNGWMSQLEMSVEPWLGPMVQSAAQTELTVDQRRKLALWAEKTVMVWELTDDGGITATQEDREFIRTHGEPTPLTHVGLARCGAPEWVSRVRHFDGSGKVRIPSPFGVDLPHAVRVRWDVIGIGEVMLLVSGTSRKEGRGVLPEVEDASEDLFSRFLRIWPIWDDNEKISYPPPNVAPLTDMDAFDLSILPGVNMEIVNRFYR